jgi:hypothetical protein
MKKAWMTGAALILATAAWVAGGAGATGAVSASDYARATDFDATGVTIHCDGSSCPVPIVVPFRFQLGSVGSPYDAVVTASFTYQTSKGLRVAASPTLYAGTNAGVAMTDGERPLAPARQPRSTTLTWVMDGLDANTSYGLYVDVHPIGTPPSSFDISTTNITLVVEAAPA